MMIDDQVPPDSPGAREIGFAIPERYNASRILFDNLVARPRRPAGADRPRAARAAMPSSARKPRNGATASSRSA